jgi:hypothetical protein
VVDVVAVGHRDLAGLGLRVPRHPRGTQEPVRTGAGSDASPVVAICSVAPVQQPRQAPMGTSAGWRTPRSAAVPGPLRA